jgi:hypothetical protein
VKVKSQYLSLRRLKYKITQSFMFNRKKKTTRKEKPVIATQWLFVVRAVMIQRNTLIGQDAERYSWWHV